LAYSGNKPNYLRPMAHPPPSSRRRFLQQSALASSVLWAGCQSTGKTTPTTTAKTAGAAAIGTREKVRLAFVGIGNRGTTNIKLFKATELVEFVTAAEVHPEGEHCREAREVLGDIPLYRDFREMLAKEGDKFDAVCISTPDFAHFPVAMACMAAGKHVYLEKPLAHTFQEVELLMAQAKRTGVVTQMGNQGHSGANYFQFKAWFEAGIIKDVTRIDAYMNSPRRWHGWEVNGFDKGQATPAGLDWDLWHVGRPWHEFSERLHPANWRSWFAYGSGAFGDWAPHILDTAHRFLDLGLPETITAVKRDGPNDFIFPQASTIQFSFPTRGSLPACEVVWYDGVDNLPKLPAEESPTVERQKNGKYIYSRDLVFKGGTHSDTLRILPAEKMKELAPTLPRISGRNPDHYENFALACLGRAVPQSPFSISGPLSQVFILGLIAQRFGGTLKFDRTTRRFTDHPFANDLLGGPPPRPGWESVYAL
jgi:predicted dehydrogenase